MRLSEHKGWVFVRKEGKWHLVEEIGRVRVVAACGKEFLPASEVLEFGGLGETRGRICKKCWRELNE